MGVNKNMIISDMRIGTLVFQMPWTSSAPSNLEGQILTQVRIVFSTSATVLIYGLLVANSSGTHSNI